jgi:hypothetical protein
MNSLKDLIGKKIMAIRPISKKELEAEGWEQYTHTATCVILLEGGTLLYPSQDDEGNGPGTLFGQDKGEHFIVWDKKTIM